MTRILAIDPGPTESAFIVIEAADCRPVRFGKELNEKLREGLMFGGFRDAPHVAIEQIGHYGTGMPAGKTVFDTCRWIGRFEEILRGPSLTPMSRPPVEPDLVLRATVKAHLCGSSKAKDPNVKQALVDRFAHGTPNHGKGTTAAPGWFFGFAADVWQAYALAVYVADQEAGWQS